MSLEKKKNSLLRLLTLVVVTRSQVTVILLQLIGCWRSPTTVLLRTKTSRLQFLTPHDPRIPPVPFSDVYSIRPLVDHSEGVHRVRSGRHQVDPCEVNLISKRLRRIPRQIVVETTVRDSGSETL